MRSDMERENKERRAELAKSERRLVQKEENVDRKMDAYEKRKKNFWNKATVCANPKNVSMPFIPNR